LEDIRAGWVGVFGRHFGAKEKMTTAFGFGDGIAEISKWECMYQP
jgi:hypothetical protein